MAFFYEDDDTDENGAMTMITTMTIIVTTMAITKVVVEVVDVVGGVVEVMVTVFHEVSAAFIMMRLNMILLLFIYEKYCIKIKPGLQSN